LEGLWRSALAGVRYAGLWRLADWLGAVSVVGRKAPGDESVFKILQTPFRRPEQKLRSGWCSVL